ncbi:AraC family transcriptional regulator [Gorillibacterium timonense]|uniref:AraC family transcriptional regulator n=1 Tax=Gorillibacterium timonense TaxID=1689269 RepID=UPI00071D0E32|nr:AraC family transcriptional regulator [Gorillibacterium timonense]
MLYIGKLKEDPSWKFPNHKHENVSEIIYVLHGEGTVRIDGQMYTVQSGDLLIYNQGILHEESSSSLHPLEMYYCGVTNVSLEGNEPNNLIPEGATPCITAKSYAHQIEALFSMMYEESLLQSTGYETVCSRLLEVLLIIIQRLAQAPKRSAKQSSEALAEQIMDYLEQNYLCHPSLKDLSRAFHMNQYYILHTFKKKYNDSPINYMLQRRMGEAKQLLINTNMKVKDIAKQLGYDNANYFTVIFTRTMGESPLEYKKTTKKERVNLFEAKPQRNRSSSQKEAPPKQ